MDQGISIAPVSTDDVLLGDDRVFLVDDEMLSEQNLTVNETSELEPVPGMKFSNADEVFEFYKRDARNIGFGVKIRSSEKGVDGEIRYAAYTCTREGVNNSTSSCLLNPRPSHRIGCPARITASSDIDGIWRILNVRLEHNHKCSPSKSRLHRCNRKLSNNVKRRLEVNDIAGIPLHKSFNSVVVEAGGYENLPCIEKDVRNFVEKARRLRLGEGDASALQNYFLRMQETCPGFFFSIDLDEKGRLKNVFWADNRCRQAYKEFGDVVTFDTTYLTNQYDMPFAPFVGVNHHGQTILLGCALVSSENTNTFVWLFRTWLKCMMDKAPSGIITDQDQAMLNAIEMVFPGTRHRWCLWHIMRKLPQKFGGHRYKGLIIATMQNVVYESQTPEEFEEAWFVMITQYNLDGHEWLCGLFSERVRWVPCYLKCSFWAGMSTTQRSESINAYFGEFVHSKTSLKQFVEQYERALKSKIEKETQADFKSDCFPIPCATKLPLEKQFQLVYTNTKFVEFQKEFTGRLYCRVKSTDEDIHWNSYEVEDEVFFDEYRSKSVTYIVKLHKTELEFTCSCNLFEFRGIICRHAATIFLENRITNISEKYVLNRWRKDIRRPYSRIIIGDESWIRSAEQERYDMMRESFAELADKIAPSEVETAITMEWITSRMQELSNSKGNCLYKFGDASEVVLSSGSILDPVRVRRKGAPKKLRLKGGMEKNVQKKQ